MKWLLISALSFTLIFALGGQASAQAQMTSTGTNYAAMNMHVTPLDKEHWVATAEQEGIRVDDTGKGPFHLLSTDIKFIFYNDKDGMQYHGYETHTDKDGDRVIWEIWGIPGTNKGKGKVIGATGKFAGMEGTMDFEVVAGSSQDRTVCKEYMKLTLKAPL